jgi:thioesterase domain-containing protein
LQKAGKRPPLYLVHTTPGDVIGYGNLIYHLGHEQPCFGFQSLGLNKKELAHTGIEEMASYYISLLQRQQPHGPYLLAGWCYGGLLAVEMANQLQAAGEEVPYLGLIETPARAPANKRLAYYLRKLSNLFKMNPSQWRQYLQEKMKYYRGIRTANEMRFKRADPDSAEDKTAIEERNQWLDQLEHVYHTNLRALDSYHARAYSGKIILYNADQQDPSVIHDPYYGWKGLAAVIERHVIPGDHDSILMEPNVALLSKAIERDLADLAISKGGSPL